jgi:ubiquinone/menaquinone biosynthesis C-methylase UbiE
MTNWIYNESKHCGIDYSNELQAEQYDTLHKKFRDYKKEFDATIDFLGISDTHKMSVIDFACGTGAATLFASEKFKTVYAVDISDAMISQARQKILSNNIRNVTFHTGGFLSYKHTSDTVDLIMTKHAFHHIPDFWKQIALYRMNTMLNMNGLLYMCDVVFNVEPQNYKTYIDKWVNGFEILGGKELRSEVETHIREEFSTFDWILEGMFTRAGFTIEKNRSLDGFASEYVCKKSREIDYEDV